MANEQDESQNSEEKYRKAETLIVEHLNLNPQDEDNILINRLRSNSCEYWNERREWNYSDLTGVTNEV